MTNRATRRAAAAHSRRSTHRDTWTAWERRAAPADIGAEHGFRMDGWFAELDRAYCNDRYAVMLRTVETAWGAVEHIAVRNHHSADIPWSHKQQIKDELVGTERVAVEVFPPASELVDAANMYHLWVLPVGFRLAFTLSGEEGPTT